MEFMKSGNNLEQVSKGHHQVVGRTSRSKLGFQEGLKGSTRDLKVMQALVGLSAGLVGPFLAIVGHFQGQLRNWSFEAQLFNFRSLGVTSDRFGPPWVTFFHLWFTFSCPWSLQGCPPGCYMNSMKLVILLILFHERRLQTMLGHHNARVNSTKMKAKAVLHFAKK